MVSPNKSKIVSALEGLDFHVERVELRDSYWHIGYRKEGIDAMLYFMVEDRGYDFQELMWRFYGFRLGETA